MNEQPELKKFVQQWVIKAQEDIQNAEHSLALKDLAILNRYAIESRYPGDWDPIYLDEAGAAVSVAEAIRREVRSLLPDEIL